MERSQIIAALGPTNTGKTFRALARMREHESGMIGLPLRLLAREVYDTLVQDLGTNEVALITGEEKVVPRAPSYWVCTVEAMPVEREVDFLAVDEIQLMGHHERGHLFTERLLHARGKKETWFIGSDTMVGIVRRLLPTADIVQFPRLSRLRCEGVYTLGSLPRRSAIVAFSVQRVYEIAERIRGKRGGVAIVLGALSPRARNAQVEMYQSGEVDYLVATDAIGLGLNLDIDRVAFADTRKFDGREERALSLGELAQIAGRAGRYHADGAFGTLAPRLPFSAQVVAAIEHHALGSQKVAYYRNSDLDFSSPKGLLHSLRKPPAHGGLHLPPEPVDAQVLGLLMKQERVREMVRNESQLRLLWQLCQIPDYRKLLIDEHAWLIGDIFSEMSTEGVLGDEYLRKKILRLREHSGDIDAIVGRIASVRTWAYVSQHSSWVAGGHWQAQTRDIDDALSDDLHRALVERFVARSNRRKEKTPRTLKKDRSLSSQLAGLRAEFEDDAEESKPAYIERLLGTQSVDLQLTEKADLEFEGVRLAALFRGRKIYEPGLRFYHPLQGGPSGSQGRVEEHLRKVVRVKVEGLFQSFFSLGGDVGSEEMAALRGISYQLREGLGATRALALRELTRILKSAGRAVLSENGIVLGRRFVYSKKSLEAENLVVRRALFVASTGKPLPVGPPNLGVHDLGGAGLNGRYSSLDFELLGYELLAERAIRFDLVEGILTASQGKTRKLREVLVMNTLGCEAEEARLIGRLLGSGGAPRKRKKRRTRSNP